jgi:hypothetical protein
MREIYGFVQAITTSQKGHVMAQLVSSWPVVTEAWVLSYAGMCGIFGGYSGTGTGFTPNTFLFLLSVSRHQ